MVSNYYYIIHNNKNNNKHKKLFYVTATNKRIAIKKLKEAGVDILQIPQKIIADSPRTQSDNVCMSFNNYANNPFISKGLWEFIIQNASDLGSIVNECIKKNEYSDATLEKMAQKMAKNKVFICIYNEYNENCNNGNSHGNENCNNGNSHGNDNCNNDDNGHGNNDHKKEKEKHNSHDSLASLGIKTKSDYNAWLKTNHPDKGGSLSTFQKIHAMAQNKNWYHA